MIVQILLFAAIFLIVISIIIFSFHISKKIKEKKKIIPVSEFLVESSKNRQEETGEWDEIAELEEIPAECAFLFWRPFTHSFNNPEFLTGSEDGVIYERNGIHYINDEAFIIDTNTEGKLNNDFVKLVESVIAIA